MEFDDRLTLAAILATGIIVPGVTSYFVYQAGAKLLSKLVWLVGYGSMVLLIWYIWIRPLDVTGAGGQ